MNQSIVSPEEEREVRERQRPRAAVIYETIRGEGEADLERGTAPLFWSALAAGLSMVFSLVTTGVIRAVLPDAPWVGLISSLGYTIGFLIVILGRQQLFTENTVTPLLPVFTDPTPWRVRQLGRLWTTIFIGNMLGAAIASAAVAYSGAFSAEQLHAFDAIAQQAIGPTFWQIAAKAFFAGWLIALMVWLLPLAEQLGPVIIIILTYVVAAAQLSHVVAGSVDVLYGAWRGATTWGDYLHFVVPTFLGNAVGGVALVAAIASAEIASERQESRRAKASRI